MSASGLLYANSTAITGTDGVWIAVADTDGALLAHEHLVGHPDIQYVNLLAVKLAAAALVDLDAEIIDRQAVLLDELPAGFRIERTRADGVPAGRDPGLEPGLIDEYDRPERLIGTGRQMIAWSNGRYLEVECAAAHCVLVRFAVLNAERFTTPVTTSRGAPA